MRTLIIGHGYIGSAFRDELARRGSDYHFAQSHEVWRTAIDEVQPEVVINCAAYIPPSGRVVDCKNDLPANWIGNASLPATMAKACDELGLTFCHISTGCLYDEERQYVETDFPIRFKYEYAFEYLTAKFIAESAIQKVCQNHYIWRIRLPFSHVSNPRNYLTKIQEHPKVWHHQNSLTHREDFTKSAIEMIEKKAPFGTYHMVNSGHISNTIIDGMLIEKGLVENGNKQFVNGPVPGTTLSTAKLEATGCGMRPVAEAVEEALRNWRKE